MRLPAIVSAAILIITPASAQQPDWNGAARIEVVLTNFEFTPKSIHLKAGRPAILHLQNNAKGGHNFAARDFFAASVVRAQDRAAIRDGAVEVGRGAAVDIAVIPRAGRYKLRCTHTLHTTFGMSGEIVVD